ncbi:MAG: hypothetical protein ACLFRD_03965 [Nitriliruptoraceae bacterium]
MDAERIRWWSEELEDELVAEQLVAARGAVVRAVPDELAASHLDAIMAEQARATVGGATHRPLPTIGSLLKQRFTVAAATSAAAAALALVLALAGTLPDPAQRMVADAAEVVGVGLPRPQPPVSERYVDPGGWRDVERPEPEERSQQERAQAQTESPATTAPQVSAERDLAATPRAADTTRTIAADRGDLQSASPHRRERSDDRGGGAANDVGSSDQAPGSSGSAPGTTGATPGNGGSSPGRDVDDNAQPSSEPPRANDRRGGTNQAPSKRSNGGQAAEHGRGSDSGRKADHGDASDDRSGPRTAGSPGTTKLNRPDEQAQGSDQDHQPGNRGPGPAGDNRSGNG